MCIRDSIAVVQVFLPTLPDGDWIARSGVAGRGAAAFAELLAETDVLVAVPHERPARVAELQLLVLHCLCDAVDFQLMGEQDP